MLFVTIFILLPFLGFHFFRWLFDVVFGTKITKDIYIIHNHYDNRQVHFNDAIPPKENHLED